LRTLAIFRRRQPFAGYHPGPPARQQALAIVVNYNSGDRLGTLLDVLEPEVRQVIVIDNASHDGSQEAAKGRDRTTFIQNEKNRGFAAAVNQGSLLATNDDAWVVLVNDDAHVRPGEMTELLKAVPENTAVIAAMQVDFDDRPLSESGGYDPAIWRYLVWSFVPVYLHYRFGPWISRPFPKGDTDLDWVSGAMLAIRRDIYFELGMLDEKYWMYVEDVDFCRKARKAGYRVIHRESVHLIHEVAAGQRERRILSGLRSVESLALDFPGWRLRALGLVLGMGYVLRAGFARKATERGLARRCLHHCAELLKGRHPERELPADADPGKSLGGKPVSTAGSGS
jgi:N-acetylglucosaminyl-diphospho-decaprenol L-rhamnosyltransferase